MITMEEPRADIMLERPHLGITDQRRMCQLQGMVDYVRITWAPQHQDVVQKRLVTRLECVAEVAF